MRFNWFGIIQFIFPEWQIIKLMNEHGFIAKIKKNDRASQGHNYPNVQTQGGRQAVQTSALFNSSASAGQQPAMQGGAAVETVSMDGNAAAYNSVYNEAISKQAISDVFDYIRDQLGALMIGQSKYLDQLCVAFKRPLVTGYDNILPKNVMIILGNKGSGKRSSITHMASLLYQMKVAGSQSVVSIDLSLYPSVSEYDLFLSDLYKGLYGKADILLFENEHKCHSSVIETITALALKGKYTLDARYTLDSSTLIAVTGLLVSDSVSEIRANGKYFVHVSEKSEKDFMHIFGSKYMDNVYDLLHTDSFNERELLDLSTKLMVELKSKCSSILGLKISWNSSVLARIVDVYKNETGAIGLNECIQLDLFKPLAEYKLRNAIKDNESVKLTVMDGQFEAQIKGELIMLANVLPRRRNDELADVKKELENIIGINSVKEYVLRLEDNMKIQQRREDAGHKMANISMHMIFTGNPGTGKTTIARIVAKYLKALGVLSTGQLREVTRADLVAQYVGQTAKQTNDVIKSALGGVLFIDEAYALCRDKHDTFGLEAIDALVKGMEDNRDQLVVILAGYDEEMTGFLKVNSGLQSRFPNRIQFEDYTSDEMVRIADITAKSKGYSIESDCKEPLLKLFDKRQIKGRNDSGNGRLVRNIIEEAILNQSNRLMGDQEGKLDVLLYDDFKFVENESFDLDASLAKIIGLQNVKEFVSTQHKLLIAQDKRRKAGLQIDITQTLNMIFSGNPGTGKTTIARIVATMFKEMGLLKQGHLVETDRGGLVAEYVGHTAKKTEEVFRSALGGILFIDEAYALTSDGSSFGMEAVNTLVKLIEDYRGEIVVILAGYNKEMGDFLKSNSGLSSRFPLKINFPDYTAEELYAIAMQMVAGKGFVLVDGADIVLKEQISILHKQSDVHSGNGRMIRNYLEEITRSQSARIATEEIEVSEMNKIMKSDIEPKTKVEEGFNLENRLAQITGLNEVKNYIRSLSARLRMQNERKRLGMSTDNTQTLHMIFKGNPGTGKTMVARTVADVLFHIGVIRTNKLVETDRAGLVAGYIGQTALKTREVVLGALDGVLFIDEAYALSQGGEIDFGREAIDTLVKMMDDYRDRLVVILAGYNANMDKFLDVNPGLKSRFPNIISFEDYDTEDLMQIAEQFFAGRGYELDNGAKNTLHRVLSKARLEPHFGNGRYVRNVFDKAINNQAIRLSADMNLTREELVRITYTDIEKV